MSQISSSVHPNSSSAVSPGAMSDWCPAVVRVCRGASTGVVYQPDVPVPLLRMTSAWSFPFAATLSMGAGRA
jgi:hypothetical protein